MTFVNHKSNKHMNRFMGMMPSSEVKKEEKIKDEAGKFIATIQAGENGWTILYVDSSSQYQDVIDTTENNFNKALSVLKSQFQDGESYEQLDEMNDIREEEI